MADRIFVRPKRGFVVANVQADMSPVPAEGTFVLRDTYINRRIDEGSLIELTAEDAEAVVAAQAEARVAEQEAELEAIAEAQADTESAGEEQPRRSRRKSRAEE